MSKGSRQRPRYISREQFEDNWDQIFNKKAKGSCRCGRSPTGDCNGWHSLNAKQWDEAKNNYNDDHDRD